MPSSSYSVGFPRSDTSGMDGPPDRVTIIQEVNQHDVMLMEYSGSFSYVEESIRSGAPVRALFKNEWSIISWFGYVNNTVPIDSVASESRGYDTEVVCVGATFPLKRIGATSTLPMNVSTFVQQKILRLGLVPLTTYSPLVQTIVQAGKSDWSMLTDLGKTLGRITFATGTTVNWLSVDEVFKYYGESAPRLVHVSKSSIKADAWAIRYYEEDVSDELVREPDEDIYLSGVNPLAVDPVLDKSLKKSLLYYTPDTVAKSGTDLKEKIEGSASLKFSKTALLKGPGNPYVRAGTVIYFKGPRFSGWWLVLKVKHIYTSSSGSHVMEVHVARREDFPSHNPSKFPKVVTSRASEFGNLNSEYRPRLMSGESPFVEGSVRWSYTDRWEANRDVW